MAKKQNKKGNYTEKKNGEPNVKIVEKIEEIPGEQLFPQTTQIIPVKEFDKPLVKLEEAIAAWEQYQDLINALIKTQDIVVVQGVKKAKKSGINKIARFFGYSCEIIRAYKEEIIGPQGGKGFVWRVWAKAIAPTGRFRVAGAACSSTERRFAHLEHDVLATAETRAKKRAIEELAGMGELELLEEEENQSPQEVKSEEVSSKTEGEGIEEYEFKGKKYVRRIDSEGRVIEEGIDPDAWSPMYDVPKWRIYANKYPGQKKLASAKQIEYIKEALKRTEINPDYAIFKLNNRADRKIREKRLSELDIYDGWDIIETIKRKKQEGLKGLVEEIVSVE